VVSFRFKVQFRKFRVRDRVRVRVRDRVRNRFCSWYPFGTAQLRAGCSTCRLELTSRLTPELSRSALHHAKIHELTT